MKLTAQLWFSLAFNLHPPAYDQITAVHSVQEHSLVKLFNQSGF